MLTRSALVFAVIAAFILPGCVSSRLAEANAESVTVLAQAAVTQDDAHLPLAEQSVETAAEIVSATGTFAQITSLGVPSDLVDQNFANVRHLADVVVPDGSPEVIAAATRAQDQAAELAGKAASQGTFRAAVKSTPIGESIAGILGSIGGIGALVYGKMRAWPRVRQRMADRKAAKDADAPA